LIFNGHTPESIAALDGITMARLQTMYGDGVIGNHKTIEMLGTLITGVFNYVRDSKSRPYTLANVAGSAYDYLYPPLPPEAQQEAVNNNLLAYLSQAPGFVKDRFKVKNDG
jgi:hypothetical protein